MCCCYLFYSFLLQRKKHKIQNTKHKLQGAGSILRNSLSDKIRAIINLAAYKLNANSTFQPNSPTASPANLPHFAQQLQPSSATQKRIVTNNPGALFLLFGWEKGRRCFLMWIRDFGDRDSPSSFPRCGFVDYGYYL